jgi:hypothetical protein
MMGVLYLALVISRLVSMQAQRVRERADRDEA